MLKEAKFIAIVNSHAAEWIGEEFSAFRIESEKRWWRTIGHHAYLETDQWLGYSYLEPRISIPTIFDFRPKKKELFMPPPWVAYPFYSAVTIGWRMGSGEEYYGTWNLWYSKLSDSRKAEFQLRYPVPVDERSWNLWFYNIDDLDS